MAFDNLCKLLSETYPDRFATWLLGTPQVAVEVLKTELSIEPIRADSVIFLNLHGRILHLEFQTKIESDPPLPLRMLDYWVRLYRRHRLPVTQVVVLLLPPPPTTAIDTAFVVENTRHEYRVVRLWEEDPEPLLQEPALLPLASLAASPVPEELLQRVAAQVQRLDDRQRRHVSNYTQILAGLKYQKAMIRQLFQEGMMRESVIYQEILEEGRQEGRKEGRQEGSQSLVLRLLHRSLGPLPQVMQAQVVALSLTQLEALAEDLLEFQAISDLETWLQSHS